ncbi:MAG: hypothetical protein ISS47_01660 [Candidatus Omnitrophica bacterium]|nr:hypothetical protein [Candidatus Omnitrophota bacterium]
MMQEQNHNYKNISRKIFLNDYILALFLIILSLKIRWNVFNSMDIGLHDSTGYLAGGLFFLHNLRLPIIFYSPLYVLWHSILEIIIPDPIKVYYIQYLATGCLTIAVLYFAMRRLSISKILSFILSLYWILLYVNVYRLMYVYHFAFFLVLLGIITITMKDKISAVISTILILILTVTARFTYILSLITFLGVILIMVGRRRKAITKDMIKKIRVSKSVYIVLIFFICFLVSLFIFLATVSELGKNRFWESFSVCYTWRYSQDHPEFNLDPWRDWPELIQEHFPGANSLPEAILIHPTVVARHVWLNLKDSPAVLFRFFFETALFRIYSLRIYPIVILFILIVFNKLHPIRNFLSNRLKDDRMGLVFLYLICISVAIMPSIFVKPFINYFFPLATLIFFYFAMYVNDLHKDTLKKLDLKIFPFISLILVISFINAFPNQKYVRKNYENIIAMRNILSKFNLPSDSRKIILLDAESQFNSKEGYNVYIDFKNCRRIDAHDKISEETFFQFISRNNINAILLTENLRQNIRFKDDIEFANFINNSEKFSWKSYLINKTNSKFYLKHYDFSNNFSN